MKILIVEDNYALRKIILKSLEEFGDCQVAVNGLEALEAVEEGLASGQHYDLITMDIMMPGIDGIEALSRIRLLERERKMSYHDSAKVIMSTALDDRKTILKAFRDQCEAFIVKPVTKEKLVEQMKKLQLITA